VEAIITVAIIGIIAAIAWPTFEAQSKRSKRTDAVKGLTIAVTELERCQSDSGSYTGCSISTTSPDEHYTIVAVTNSYDFALTASQNVYSDEDCVTLTLNHLGQKGFTGSAPTIKRCWAQ
jgi:type IV pilus assembly protein PilE